MKLNHKSEQDGKVIWAVNAKEDNKREGRAKRKGGREGLVLLLNYEKIKYIDWGQMGNFFFMDKRLHVKIELRW